MEQMRFTLEPPPPLPDIDLDLDMNLGFDLGLDTKGGDHASTCRDRVKVESHRSMSTKGNSTDNGSAYQPGEASVRGQFLDGMISFTQPTPGGTISRNDADGNSSPNGVPVEDTPKENAGARRQEGEQRKRNTKIEGKRNLLREQTIANQTLIEVELQKPPSKPQWDFSSAAVQKGQRKARSASPGRDHSP